MRRCPQCNRVETDDSLVFCRTDGAALVSDSLPPSGEAGTARLGSPAAEIETSILPHATDANASRSTGPTTVLRPAATSTGTRELTKPKRSWVVIAIVAFVAAVSIAGYFYFTRKTQTTIQSIAVMPFVNESGNADVEYLSDGMTETLISNLSQLPNLNVKARSSVFRYKGKEIDPKKIGAELSVQAILNGRVVQRGDQLTLTLELMDAQTENVLWSEQYNRKQADLVSLQTEIARDVSSKLKIKLSGTDEAKLTRTRTANPEAYQLYLKGRYHSSRQTEEGFRKGIEYFNQAIALDPAYAQAYDGLAYCYYSNWYIPAKEGGGKGKAAALKALEIDPLLAEAHSSLGSIYAWFDYDWAASEREYRRAIELNPNYGLAHGNYAALLVALGRFDEAVTEAKRAVELEPLSAELNTLLGIVYYYARRYDQAAVQLTKTIEFEPNFWWAHTFLARSYEKTGKLSAAIAELERTRLMEGATVEVLAALGHAYAASGKRDQAQKIISELKEPAKRIWVDGYEIAVIEAALGEKDQAFAHLDKEYATGGWTLNFLKVDPDLDPLRADPRFKEMLKRLNLPE